jgi:hypothetical protein
MRCRAVVCAACSTRVEGINHCHVCMKKLGERPERPPGAMLPRALAMAVVLGLAWLALFGALWVVQGRMAP